MGLYDDVYDAFAAVGVRYVVVDLEPAAAAQAVQALEALGLQPRVPVSAADFADPAIRTSWIRDKHMQVLSFYDPQHLAREVDVLVAYPPDFEQPVARAVPTAVGGRLVPVAAPEHLIEMKRAAGRPRDLEDVAALQRIQDRRSGGDR